MQNLACIFLTLENLIFSVGWTVLSHLNFPPFTPSGHLHAGPSDNATLFVKRVWRFQLGGKPPKSEVGGKGREGEKEGRKKAQIAHRTDVLSMSSPEVVRSTLGWAQMPTNRWISLRAPNLSGHPNFLLEGPVLERQVVSYCEGQNQDTPWPGIYQLCADKCHRPRGALSLPGPHNNFLQLSKVIGGVQQSKHTAQHSQHMPEEVLLLGGLCLVSILFSKFFCPYNNNL